MTTKFMRFIIASLMVVTRRILFPWKIREIPAGLVPALLKLLTHYHFLHARLINSPPGFYENVIINTRRPARRSFSRFAENSTLARTRQKCRLLNHFTPRLSAIGGETEEGKGEEEVNTYSYVQQKGEDEEKKKEERKREQEEKREKRQRAGVAGACAGIRDAGVLSTAWRRDARRRQ